MGVIFFSLLLFAQVSREYRIGAIQFEGNASFQAHRLRTILVSKKKDPFSEAILKYDIDRLTSFYGAQGFFDTQIDYAEERDEEKDRITIKIKVKEGFRPKIDRIVLAGVDDTERKNLRGEIFIKEGEYLLEDKISRSRLAITNEFKEKGYPYINVTSNFALETNYLILTVKRGTLVYFRNVKLSGLKKYRAHLVEREIRIKKGRKYQQSKILTSQRAIYSLGLFGYVDASTEKVNQESVDVNFVLTEISPRIFNFGFGAQFPLRLLSSVGFQHLNFFNNGHVLSSKVSFAVNLQREYDVKFEPQYLIPHVLNSQIYLILYPFVEYENLTDFTRMTRGAEGKVVRALSDHVQLNLANRYKFVDTKSKVHGGHIEDTSEVTNSIISNLLFDFRDDFFVPNHGLYLLPLIEYAGGFLGGDNNFWRVSTEIRFFIPLIYGTGALRLKVGRIYARQMPISIHEKFSLGGEASIRGFDEKSLGPDSLQDQHYGDILANGNVEYRFDLYKNLGGLIFFDIGDLRNDIGDFAWSDVAKGVGIGVRFRTPIGPLRLDYGRGFNQRKGRLYFGLYHIF